jgi:hypothetical protein
VRVFSTSEKELEKQLVSKKKEDLQIKIFHFLDEGFLFRGSLFYV